MVPQHPGDCLRAGPPAAQALRAAHTPFLNSSRPHSPASVQNRKQGRRGYRGRPGFTPHSPTDELGRKGLGASREVGVWPQPQILVGLYSHHGGQEDFFSALSSYPPPQMCGSCFAASVKGTGSWGLALHLSVNTPGD